MQTTYKFQRGEPINIGRKIDSGVATGFTLEAKLKPLPQGTYEAPSDDILPVADFTITYVPDAGIGYSYWNLYIPGLTTMNLPAGKYITDVKFIYNSEVVKISEEAIIILKNSVSG